MLLMSPRTFAAICIFGVAGCPGPKAPSVPAAASQTIEVGRTGASLLGAAASDDGVVYAALASTAKTTIEARRGNQVAWTRELEGRGGPLAVAGDLVYVTVAGTGTVAGGAVRGEPGAAVVALDRATGTVRWRVALDAAGWVTVGATAATPEGGLVVGGTYTNGLRAADKVVGSGGRTDGFVALLRPTGQVAWLVRMGGTFADGIQGVAARADGSGATRIAIAGTFQSTADLQGTPLPFFDERSPYPDGFVAELDASGVRRWSAAFGGKLLESVVGVAIDAGGKVVVAANSNGQLHVGAFDLVPMGPSDGVLSWWNADGSPDRAVLVGGADFDGLRAITAAGPSVVVGGFYSGSMSLGEHAITAAGGDDAFLAAFAPNGTVVEAWPITGAGREEVVSLTPLRGGVVAGAAYTAAASLAGATVSAPADPMSGAAVLVRGTR